MTENKRFLIDDAGELIDLENHKFIDYGDECCKLLNELSDENEQLKRSVQYWYAEHKRIVNNYVDKIKEVEKENEQLKKENYELHKRLGDFEPFEDHIKEITSKTSVKE